VSLEEKLARRRKQFKEMAAPEVASVMEAATQQLIDSNLASKILGPGETLPEFELPNVDGKIVRSSELLSQGKLVLTIYRGVW
jgi:hypothetical protein